jgi:hypothetical protein
MLRLFYSMEESYYSRGEAEADPERRAARMGAREEVASVSVLQARESLENFEKQKAFIPVIVKGVDGQERSARLYEVAGPRDNKAFVIHMLLEGTARREFRHSVEQAVKEHQERLKQDYRPARECAEIAKAAAVRTREHFPSQEAPAPVFTPKQINQLEMYAVRCQDRDEQARLKGVISAAEREARVEADDRAERRKQQLGGGRRQDKRHRTIHDDSRTDHRSGANPGQSAERDMAFPATHSHTHQLEHTLAGPSPLERAGQRPPAEDPSRTVPQVDRDQSAARNGSVNSPERKARREQPPTPERTRQRGGWDGNGPVRSR